MTDDDYKTPIAHRVGYWDKGELQTMTGTQLVDWVRTEAARIAKKAIGFQVNAILEGVKKAFDTRTETMRKELDAEYQEISKALAEDIEVVKRERRSLIEEATRVRDDLSRLRRDRDTIIRQIAEQCAPLVTNYVNYGNIDGPVPNDPAIKLTPTKTKTRRNANGAEGHA